MSVHPRLSVHRSQQALRFCSSVNRVNLCGGRRAPQPLVSSSTSRRTAAYSQSTSDLLVEGHQMAPSHSQKAWEHWRKLGAPKFHVAPMVDQYGATAAYTPMLHARLFSEGAKYRDEHLTTCPEDRPLFVQFCANDPDVLVKAAQHVEEAADYIDLNFGCPQRIAKKGRYGAFLMDDLPCVASLVRALHERTSTPVSAKIRIFSELSRTLEYAKLIEESGASLLAVHGRTREQKDAASIRADWDAIKAVKDALSIPVLGNGDVRSRADAVRMMEYTGVDGVMSAAPLLDDPRLFWENRETLEPYTPLKSFEMAHEYLNMCEKYPVPIRMVRGHIHKIVGAWFQEHTSIRDEFNKSPELTVAFCQKIITKLEAAALAVGRERPVPKISERKLARLAREEAISGAKREQEREDRLVAILEKKRAAETGGAELKKGEGNAKEADPQASQKRTHSEGGLSTHVNGSSMGVEGGAVATADAAIVANAAEGTADAVENGITATVASQVDQNCAPVQSLGASRKQARLMGCADGGAS